MIRKRKLTMLPPLGKIYKLRDILENITILKCLNILSLYKVSHVKATCDNLV